MGVVYSIFVVTVEFLAQFPFDFWRIHVMKSKTKVPYTSLPHPAITKEAGDRAGEFAKAIVAFLPPYSVNKTLFETIRPSRRRRALRQER